MIHQSLMGPMLPYLAALPRQPLPTEPSDLHSSFSLARAFLPQNYGKNEESTSHMLVSNVAATPLRRTI